MYNILKTRLQQGQRTIDFPAAKAALSDRFRGLPKFDANHCPQDCRQCAEVCPTEAIQIAAGEREGRPTMDLGRCLFCVDCACACPQRSIEFSSDYRLATQRRSDLLFSGKELKLAEAMRAEIHRLFKRSLKLRQVSAGGCNGCEVDINVLTTTVYDLGRFGVQIVASPRHADGLIITGPVTENMRLALLKTYEATPPPRLVIAVGACAISGGPFREHPETHNGVESLLAVDLFIPGCPPHPLTILDGLLRLLGKMKE